MTNDCWSGLHRVGRTATTRALGLRIGDAKAAGIQVFVEIDCRTLQVQQALFVYDEIDEDTIRVVTAYEVPEQK